MSTARSGPATDHTSRPGHAGQAGRAGRGRRTRGDGRRSRWLLGMSGLALLVVSVIMMASGAEPSIAQTVRPAQAPARLARLRLPTPPGRHPALLRGTLAEQEGFLSFQQRKSFLLPETSEPRLRR